MARFEPSLQNRINHKLFEEVTIRVRTEDFKKAKEGFAAMNPLAIAIKDQWLKKNTDVLVLSKSLIFYNVPFDRKNMDIVLGKGKIAHIPIQDEELIEKLSRWKKSDKNIPFDAKILIPVSILDLTKEKFISKINDSMTNIRINTEQDYINFLQNYKNTEHANAPTTASKYAQWWENVILDDLENRKTIEFTFYDYDSGGLLRRTKTGQLPDFQYAMIQAYPVYGKNRNKLVNTISENGKDYFKVIINVEEATDFCEE